MTNHEFLEQQDIDAWDLNEKEPLLLHNINKAMNALRKELAYKYYHSIADTLQYRANFIDKLLKAMEEESDNIRKNLSAQKSELLKETTSNP